MWQKHQEGEAALAVSWQGLTEKPLCQVFLQGQKTKSTTSHSRVHCEALDTMTLSSGTNQVVWRVLWTHLQKSVLQKMCCQVCDTNFCPSLYSLEILFYSKVTAETTLNLPAEKLLKSNFGFHAEGILKESLWVISCKGAHLLFIWGNEALKKITIPPRFAIPLSHQYKVNSSEQTQKRTCGRTDKLKGQVQLVTSSIPICYFFKSSKYCG